MPTKSGKEKRMYDMFKKEAELNLEILQNQARNIELNLNRYKNLQAQDLVSKYDVEQLELNLSNIKNMITITRDQLKEIRDIACPEWRGKITKIAQDQPFGDIVLGDGAINQMFLAATQSQLPVLERIFGKQNQMKIDMEENEITNSKGQSFNIFCGDLGIFRESRQFDDLILIDESVFNVEIITRSGFKYIQIKERK
jgi:hypothetical protein